MNLPDDFYQFTIFIIAICVLWAFVAYYTKGGRNFRSIRNKRARRQL